MAKELRWEILTQTVADGTLLSHAGAEFRNDSNDNLFIRYIDWTMIQSSSQGDERAGYQLSKQNTFASTNNEPVFRLETNTGIEGSSIGTGPDDGTVIQEGVRLFAQGQLVLEPNESLFDSISKTSGGSATSRWMIGFHY